MKKEKKGYSDHHLVYANIDHRQDEITIPIRNKEHYAVSLIQRFRYVSYGFLISMAFEILKLLVRKVNTKLVDDAKEVNP